MGRSRRLHRHLRASFLGAACLIAAARCNGPQTTVRRFAPNELKVAGDQLRLEMLTTTYDERQLTVVAAVANIGQEPVLIERGGILLAFDDLEFPAADPLDATEPADIRLDPGEQREVHLTFETGTRVVDEATLLFRSVRRGDRWEGVVRLPVAPAPPGFEPDA